MRSMNRWLGVSIASVALLGLTREARAEVATDRHRASPKPAAEAPGEAPARSASGPGSWPAEVRAIFVGVSGGVGFAGVTHPRLQGQRLLGPLLEFQLGYRVSPRWAVSLVYSDFHQSVSRGGVGDLFATSASFIRPAAGCNNCKPALPGGDVRTTTFRLGALGPAVDVTPFGRDGVFLGASAGLSVVGMLEVDYGFVGSARAGYRLRPVDNLAIAVEGGAQGHAFSGGTALVGHVGAEVRLGF